MKPSITDITLVALVATKNYSSEWYDAIYNYIKDGTLLELVASNACTHLKKIATKYIILVNVLYRLSFDGILLRCLRDFELIWHSSRLMPEVVAVILMQRSSHKNSFV